MEKKVKSTRKWSLPMTGLFALFCPLLVVGGLFLTQVILLQNSQQWGNQLARQCPEEDAVLAFATSLESENGLALPKGSSYYLCDAQGQLLYARTEFSADPQRLSGYIHTIFQQIKAGQLGDAKEYVYGSTSEKRAVYFTTAENGWVSIITIPYSALLGNLRQVFYGACAICGAFFSLLLFFGLRERLARRKTVRAAETVTALGNLYYAIYRVNVGRGSYEVIKGSKYVLQ